MTKNLILLILSLLFLQAVKAQKTPNTLLYLMNNDGRVVKSKDSADYFMLIAPIDSAMKLYNIIKLNYIDAISFRLKKLLTNELPSYHMEILTISM
jgi:hypothetical protein